VLVAVLFVSVTLPQPTRAASAWTTVASLNTARYVHTATLLPSGEVLVAGGYTNSGFSGDSSTEVYDPGLNTWTTVTPLSTARTSHTATLLLNSKILVAGGWNGSDLNSVEVYDQGLSFNDAWRPTISSVSSPLEVGKVLSLTGSGFRGFGLSEASGGGTYSSATNYPLVQIRRLDNDQWLWVSPEAFSSTSYTSLQITNLPKGPALVTVFVNGIPSLSKMLVEPSKYYVFLPIVIR
jgi:hypothetical protein